MADPDRATGPVTSPPRPQDPRKDDATRILPTLARIELANLAALGDGRTVEWEATGEGEDLVWFEGGPGFWAHLARPDVALVADRFRCHLVNAPGCGRTSPPRTTAEYSVAGDATFYEEAVEAIGLERFTLMGHSGGGTVAVAYAALHPERVRRLIVIAGWGGAGLVDQAEAQAETDRVFDRLRDRPWFAAATADLNHAYPTEEEQAEAFGRHFPLYFAEPDAPVAREHIDRIRREYRFNMAVFDHYEADDAIDLTPYLGRIRCPTLVIAGAQDWICGPAWNRPIAAGIPGAELHVIAESGHLPQYETPERFRTILFDWMARTPAE